MVIFYVITLYSNLDPSDTGVHQEEAEIIQLLSNICQNKQLFFETS